MAARPTGSRVDLEVGWQHDQPVSRVDLEVRWQHDQHVPRVDLEVGWQHDQPVPSEGLGVGWHYEYDENITIPNRIKAYELDDSITTRFACRPINRITR